MPHCIRHRQPLPETLPDSLQLLQQPGHVMLLDAEEFWSDLALSLRRNKHERGRGFGMSWAYTTINPEFLRPFILPCKVPNNDNIDLGIDWITIRLGRERVVLIHYVITDPTGLLCIKVGVIGSSSFAVAKLRLIGDQAIQAAADRQSERLPLWRR
jgi:hypothetical protein